MMRSPQVDVLVPVKRNTEMGGACALLAQCMLDMPAFSHGGRSVHTEMEAMEANCTDRAGCIYTVELD